MADEQVDANGVKLVAQVPPTSAEQNEQAKPPVEENSTSVSSDNRIPLPRFNEVIEQRNHARELAERLDARLRAMEDRLPPAKSASDEAVERLVKSGVAEATAREVVRTAEAVGNNKSREVQAQMAQYQLAEWHRNMESKYKDYRETTSDMEKVFSSLPAQTQAMITSSQDGLDMLYHKAKAIKGLNGAQSAFEEGARAASAQRDGKLALSGSAGKGSLNTKPALSNAVISAMSTDDYKKRESEINEWLAGKPRR